VKDVGTTGRVLSQAEPGATRKERVKDCGKGWQTPLASGESRVPARQRGRVKRPLALPPAPAYSFNRLVEREEM
jgi:hypothetical protein